MDIATKKPDTAPAPSVELTDAQIDDVRSLFGHVEGHLVFGREYLDAHDYPNARKQIEEILGWAEAARKVLSGQSELGMDSNRLLGNMDVRCQTHAEGLVDALAYLRKPIPPQLDIDDDNHVARSAALSHFTALDPAEKAWALGLMVDHCVGTRLDHERDVMAELMRLTDTDFLNMAMPLVRTAFEQRRAACSAIERASVGVGRARLAALEAVAEALGYTPSWTGL